LLLLASLFVLLPPARARQFTQALPGYHFSFPRDHASHDDYKTEWWYFTGHLHADDGRVFGYELTFFRTAPDIDDKATSKWSLKNIYLAHYAITDSAGHKFFFQEKLNRAGFGTADARQDIARVFNEDWSMDMLGDKFVLNAESPSYSVHLLLEPQKQLVLHGKDGVSQKAGCKGCASHYYSYSRLKTAGTIKVGDKAMKVDGLSWMDHEFGSNQLTKEQVGWDWYSIQLNNNCEAMLYVMRRTDGSFDPYSSGTLILPDGSSKHLSLSDFSIKSTGTWKSTATGANYPMGWQVYIPQVHASLTIDPLLKDQELVTKNSTGVTYWEGAGNISGTWEKQPVKGEAYVEMTGYAAKFNKNI
jgi:predicted secreted hydrolase